MEERKLRSYIHERYHKFFTSFFFSDYQVSETENIRKNLSIERMIAEGCDILLDMNQVFVRQGESLPFSNSKPNFKYPSLLDLIETKK
jgi:hypothetical protein